jgi:hypothetical protein
VIDLSTTPRIAQIAGRIERLSEPGGGGVPPDVAAREVGALYQELGRYVHWMIRQDPAALARAIEEGRSAPAGPAPAPGAATLGFQPRRVQAGVDAPGERIAPPASPVAAEPAPRATEAAPSEGDRRSSAPRGGPGPVTLALALEGEPTQSQEGRAREPDAVTLTDLEPVGDEEPAWNEAGPAAMHADEDYAPWLEAFGRVVQDLGSDAERARGDVLVARLLAASQGLEGRWEGFPELVQQAVVGAIAGLARAELSRRPGDTELRLLLGRLRRFHEVRQLAPVAALAPGGTPEGASWDRDAEDAVAALRQLTAG